LTEGGSLSRVRAPGANCLRPASPAGSIPTPIPIRTRAGQAIVWPAHAPKKIAVLERMCSDGRPAVGLRQDGSQARPRFPLFAKRGHSVSQEAARDCPTGFSVPPLGAAVFAPYMHLSGWNEILDGQQQNAGKKDRARKESRRARNDRRGLRVLDRHPSAPSSHPRAAQCETRSERFSRSDRCRRTQGR